MHNFPGTAAFSIPGHKLGREASGGEAGGGAGWRSGELGEPLTGAVS